MGQANGAGCLEPGRQNMAKAGRYLVAFRAFSAHCSSLTLCTNEHAPHEQLYMLRLECLCTYFDIHGSAEELGHSGCLFRHTTTPPGVQCLKCQCMSVIGADCSRPVCCYNEPRRCRYSGTFEATQARPQSASCRRIASIPSSSSMSSSPAV